MKTAVLAFPIDVVNVECMKIVFLELCAARPAETRDGCGRAPRRI